MEGVEGLDVVDLVDLLDSAGGTSVNPPTPADRTEGNTHAQRHQHIRDSA